MFKLTPKNLFQSQIKGFIFDCDGVLIDSRHSNIIYYNAIRKYFSLPSLSEEEIAYSHMQTVKAALLHIIPPEFQSVIPAALKTIDYWQDIFPLICLEQGIREFLELSEQNNKKLAVHTNRSESVNIALDKLNLSSFFSIVVNAQNAEPKPSPDGIFKILEFWKLKAHEVLFIGDSLLDQQAAKQAKVFFAAFKNKELDADLYLTNFNLL